MVLVHLLKANFTVIIAHTLGFCQMEKKKTKKKRDVKGPKYYRHMEVGSFHNYLATSKNDLATTQNRKKIMN